MCPAKHWKCFTCHKEGHTIVCTKSQQKRVGAIHSIGKINKSLEIELLIENQNVKFEVDTGACVTIISEEEYLENFNHVELKRHNFNLSTVTGEQVKELGHISVTVSFGKMNYQLDLVVIDSKKKFTPLIGRTWLDVLFPEWRNSFGNTFLYSVSHSVKITNELQLQFSNIFNTTLNDSIVCFEADIVLKPNQVPIFHGAYSVPYKLREKVIKELDRLVEEKVLVPVKHSRWASPIVVVPKPNGEIRLCIISKVTINKCIQTEHYPLPRVDDIFASLAGCKYFCVVDLRGAYQQLSVSDSLRELLTINTLKGLFAYTRVPFGVSSAPSIFQSVMDRILLNLDHVFAYLDDI